MTDRVPPPGKHPAYILPRWEPLTMTVEEACARVDAWTAEEQFGLHQIARALREAIRQMRELL